MLLARPVVKEEKGLVLRALKETGASGDSWAPQGPGAAGAPRGLQDLALRGTKDTKGPQDNRVERGPLVLPGPQANWEQTDFQGPQDRRATWASWGSQVPKD